MTVAGSDPRLSSACVNVVSAGFTMWKTDPLTDVHSAERFVSGDAYAHSKLLNVLASLAWARRLAGDQIAVNLVHPGLSWTQMTQSMTAQTMPSLRLVWPLLRLLQRRGSPVKAGLRVAFVASLQPERGYPGRYFQGRRTPSPLSARELDESSKTAFGAWGPNWWRRPPPAACRSHTRTRTRKHQPTASRPSERHAQKRTATAHEDQLRRGSAPTH